MGDLKKILIVDDEETITFSLYQAFIKAPYDCEVVTASSGEDALEKLEDGFFDLVITDIAMPGIDGLELLSIIKSRVPKTKVVIITAYGTDEREERAYKIGADKYIEKPFDISELRNLVFKMIE
jgi:YesN/AraC family two-component response regulator